MREAPEWAWWVTVGLWVFLVAYLALLVVVSRVNEDHDGEGE